MKNKGGYEKNYQNLLQTLRFLKLENAAYVLGLTYNKCGAIEILFLGESYRIKSDGVYKTNGNLVSSEHGSILIRYLMCERRSRLTGVFVPLEQLTEMVRGPGRIIRDKNSSLLCQYADDKLPHFQKAIEDLGGRAGGAVGSGGKSWIISVLPHIPVQLIFYAGCTTFPSEILILFDKSATNFLEYKYLSVLTSLLIEKLTHR